ncbi:hypothetical protein [Bacillus alkalicellulosilyticus]|uniref:hypothetical protein n=1 Tax=Alkalihalobacterium alkalicellulosilyticum TaxID=1912214 RepID=UPI0009966384|nr:hypothetical protein [Bacillus alkalicellulosilyticus]
MKAIRNENGLALVVVLLIITVFTVLGLSLFALSVNSSKHAQVTEIDVQTVDISEMGFVHYSMRLEDFLEKEIQTYKPTIQTLMVNDLQANTLKSQEHYEKMVADHLIARLHAAGVTEKLVPPNGNRVIYNKFVDAKDNRQFQLIMENKNSDIFKETIPASAGGGQMLKLSVKSEGIHDDGLLKSVEATIEFKIDRITLPHYVTGGTGHNYDLTQILIPPNPPNTCTGTSLTTSTTNCKFSSSITIDASNANIIGQNYHITGTVTSKVNITSIQNTKMHMTGEFKQEQTIGRIEGSELYIGQDANFRNFNNNPAISSSKIVVIGDAVFPEPINGMSNSQIYVGGNATFRNTNNNITDSTVVIRGNATFLEPINIGANSSYFINGNARFNQRQLTIHSTAKVCVNGTVSELQHARSSYPRLFTPDSANFSTVCTVPGTQAVAIGDNFLKWFFDATNIDYTYK